MSWGAIAATAACFVVILVFLADEMRRIGQFRKLTSIRDREHRH